MSGSITQGGAIVPGHAAAFAYSGVVGDGGTAAAGNITTLGITNATGGAAFGINNAPITSPYGSFTVAISATGVVTLAVSSANGAIPAALQFSINGTIYPFGTGNGNVVGPSHSTIGNAALFNSTTGSTLSDAGAPPVLATNASISAALTTWLLSLPTSPQLAIGWWNSGGVPTRT